MTSKIIPIFFGVLTRLFQNLIIYVLLARIFEPEEFAFLALVFSLVLMFANMLDFGLRLRIGVEFSKISNDFSKFISIWLTVKIIGFFVFLIVLCSYIFYLVDSPSEGLYFILALVSGLLLTIAYFFAYFLSADEHYVPEILLNILLLIGSLVAFILMVATENSIWFILLLLFTNIMCLALSYYLFVKKFGNFKFSLRQLSKESFFQELREGMPYALHLFFTIFNGYFDVVMIELLSDRLVLADYQILTRIIMGLTLPLVVLTIFLPPRLRKHKMPIRFGKLINKLLILLFVFVSFFYYVLDSDLISLIFGDSYLHLSKFTWFVIFILGMKYLQIVPGTFITFYVSQMTRAISLIITSVFMVIGFIILVPIYNIEGGLIALAMSNLILLFLYWYHQRNVKEKV